MIEQRVVDGERRALGELDGEREVVLVEPASRGLARAERDGAERAATGDERRGEERGRRQVPVELAALGVERDGVERLVGVRRLQMRLPRRNDARHRMRRVAEHRVAPPELVQRPLALGVDVDVDDVLQRAVVAEQVYQAVVGDCGHHEPRDLRQSLVDGERGGQRPSGVGQEAQPLLRAALPRELVDDVDRQPHPAVLVEDGRGAHERLSPATLNSDAPGIVT